jgi:asparagine synthase (glutamine-hydrolysing)
MDTDEMLRLLRSSTEECVASSDTVAVAYSGGVDSAVIEKVAREFTRTICYTCAVRGSHDHGRAPISAAESGVELQMIVLDREKLVDLVSKACSVLGSDDPLRIAYTIPILSVIEASEHDVVLVGSGADELFGGYAKYLESTDPSATMANDSKKMQLENASLKKYAKSMGKRMEAPFVSDGLMSFARGLPIDRKLGHGERKVILREVAKTIGVLSHDAPKKAAQYSSGVMKEMRKMAKKQGKELREWTLEIAAESRRIP